MNPAIVLGVLLALSGCAHAAGKTAPEPANAKAETTTMSGPAVEAKYNGVKANKPPSATLLLDVTLRNAEKTPRWFVFPSTLPASDDAAEGGVIGVEALDASDKGHLVIGKFLGSAAFQAVLVPAGGEVTITRLGIQTWKGPAIKGPVTFEVLIAKEITVGGEPAAAWFATTVPASDARASGDASKAKYAPSRKTEDRSEVKVVFDEDRRIPLEIAVP